MRLVIAVLILGLAAFTAHAVSYSNDSNSVDIDYTGPAPILPPDTNVPDTTAGTGGGGGDQSQQSGGTDTVTVSVTATTGGDANTTTGTTANGTDQGTAGNGAGGQTSTEAVSGEDIIRALLGNQALLLGGGASDDENGGGGYSVTISGAKTRAALRARGISGLSVLEELSSRFLSQKDFALVATSRILQNKQIEEVILSLDIITLSYRAEGRLLAFIPWEFPVRVTINPNAATPETRVIITLPWYRFFLQTFFTRSELVGELNAAIDKIKLEETHSIDAKTKLFTAVTDAIAARFDTVGGTFQ